MLDLGFLRIGIKADTAQAKAELKGFEKGLEDVDSTAQSSSSKIKDALGKFAPIAATAAAAVGAAAVAITKAGLDAYAQYEQLAGGVETLFGESADVVKGYADEAYKTAGMSANKYMETVTGFSASLLQSLGGDSAAAAEYANQAVIDMSDNANKMGTSMESIENAYQGFAKQNYTMLDNLKLGYGGTKEEMQRLIDDANRVKEANGEMADLSIDSFADVTEAIHIVQEEMGIAGATAEEAASTIEGSVNQMKGAWDNWLTGLANPDADMALLTENLINSVITVGQNVLPAIGRIIQSIADLIPQIFDKIKAMLPQQFQNIINDCGTLINGIKNLFIAFFPLVQAIWQGGFDVVKNIVQTAMNIIENVIKLVSSIIKGDWQGAWEAIKGLASSVWNGIKNIINSGINAVKNIINAILQVIRNLWNGAWNGISSFLSSIWGTMKSSVSNGINGIVDFFRNMPSRILSALGNVGNLLVNAGKQIIDGFLNGLKSAFGKVQDFVGGIGDWIAAHKGPKEYDLKLLIPNGGWIMESLATGLKKAMPEVQKALDSVAGEIQGYDFGAATVEADFNAYKGRKAASNSNNNVGRGETTIVVNNYSPKALTEKESARQFRQSARQLAFA
ncbi:Uncharacterised protein [Collinsella intestinalis]|nr:Uncharacterised protein [Collinsella intestinalis]